MTAPDMTASIAPRSDQINAEDLIPGPVTITVTEVKRGTTEQPVDIVTAEFGPGRPYKPSKTMRRILVAAWGTNTADYIGRRIMIYRDPEITFGRDKVGGIRISALSHIDAPVVISLTVTRGRRAPFRVEPLAEGPQEITPEDATDFLRAIAEATTIAELDTVARDLKGANLGSHRELLQAAWSERKREIEA